MHRSPQRALRRKLHELDSWDKVRISSHITYLHILIVIITNQALTAEQASRIDR